VCPIPAISRSHIRASRQSASLDAVGLERGIKLMSPSVRIGMTAIHGLPSILFAYLGMCMPEISDRDWDVASNPFHSTGVPLEHLLL